MKESATIFVDYARVCKKHKNCRGCPLSIAQNGMKVVCLDLIKEYPDKANEIVLNWCKEHPTETRQDKFLKMFSNASKTNDGIVNICPNTVDAAFNMNCFDRLCSECRKDYWLAEEIDE